MVTKQYVQSGACVNDGLFSVCALEPSLCVKWSVHQEGGNYISALSIQSQGKRSPGFTCLTQDATMEVQVGMCMRGDKDHRLCTSTAESCDRPTEFLPQSGNCNIVSNRDSLFPHYTLYPACVVGDMTVCVWSNDDCADFGESASSTTTPVFFPAFKFEAEFASENPNQDSCTCDKVETGACMLNGEYFCAVSKDACDIGTWVSPRELREATPQIDCRLCEQLSKLHAVEPQASPILDTGGESPRSGTSRGGAIIGGAVAGAAVVLVVVGTLWHFSRKKKDKEDTASAASSTMNRSQTEPQGCGVELT